MKRIPPTKFNQQALDFHPHGWGYDAEPKQRKEVIKVNTCKDPHIRYADQQRMWGTVPTLRTLTEEQRVRNAVKREQRKIAERLEIHLSRMSRLNLN